MKKHILLFIFCLFLIYSMSHAQENKNSYLDDNVLPLDVEDKEIEMVDTHQLIKYYKHIVRTMMFEDDLQESGEAGNDDKKKSKIQALKVAFLSSKLDLKVDESQSFWPVYNEYVEELKLLKDEQNEIIKDEKVLDIRKKYKPKFEKIIDATKTNQLFKAEKDFKKLMQETILMQKLNKHKPQD